VVFFREEPTLSAQNSKKIVIKDPFIRYPSFFVSSRLKTKENTGKEDEAR